MDEIRRIFPDDFSGHVAEYPLCGGGGILDFPFPAEEAYRITAVFNESTEPPFAFFDLILAAFPADEVADLPPQRIRHLEYVGVRFPALPREQHDDSRHRAAVPDRKCEEAAQARLDRCGREFPARV